jgi:hypothetical protein
VKSPSATPTAIGTAVRNPCPSAYDRTRSTVGPGIINKMVVAATNASQVSIATSISHYSGRDQRTLSPPCRVDGSFGLWHTPPVQDGQRASALLGIRHQLVQLSPAHSHLNAKVMSRALDFCAEQVLNGAQIAGTAVEGITRQRSRAKQKWTRCCWSTR